MRASGPGKRTGRTDKARQLAGCAGTPREHFLSRRWICAFLRQYGWADPQLQRRDANESKAIYAWRAPVSMHISTRWSREAVAGPAALPDRRHADGRKAGGPTCEKGVRCGRPTHGMSPDASMRQHDLEHASQRRKVPTMSKRRGRRHRHREEGVHGPEERPSAQCGDGVHRLASKASSSSSP